MECIITVWAVEGMHKNNRSGRKPENECIITCTVEGVHKKNMAVEKLHKNKTGGERSEGECKRAITTVEEMHNTIWVGEIWERNCTGSCEPGSRCCRLSNVHI